MLRRLKQQVAKDLPDRVEEDLLCEMEGEQQTLYRAELKRAKFDAGAPGAGRADPGRIP